MTLKYSACILITYIAIVSQRLAWKYQRGGVRTGAIGYRNNGKQVLRSTKKRSVADADKELAKVELLFGAAQAGSLTEELYQSLTGAGLPKITLAGEIGDWLLECRATTAEKTVTRYEAFAREFKTAVERNRPRSPAFYRHDR